MTFYSRYNSIFAALKSKLVYVAAVPEVPAVPAHDDVPEVPAVPAVAASGLISLKTVVTGERYKYEDGLPAAIIDINSSPIKQVNMDQLEITANFTVLILCRTEEPDDWFTDVISVMSDVLDAVHADRTLNGTVFDVTPTGFAPFNNGKFANRTYFGGAVSFSAIMMY